MQMNGIVGYLLTPCDASGQVDHLLLTHHVERLVGLGVHGLCPLGSVGCLPYLSDEEREAVIRTVVAAAAGRVPVLAGVSSLSTAQTVRHARFAQAAGATAIQVLPSTYWKLTESEIFEYYRQVAEAVSIPLMIYNNPFTTGLDLSVSFLSKLAQLPNVSLIKEASPDESKIARLRDACPDHVGIFVGLNSMAKQAFRDGATGWCTAAPNVCAPFILNFHRCVVSGDWAGAEHWFAKQAELLNFLMDHGLPRTVSAGLELSGVPAGRLRAPLSALSPAQIEAMKAILETMEII